jgi:hypothetical protein
MPISANALRTANLSEDVFGDIRSCLGVWSAAVNSSLLASQKAAESASAGDDFFVALSCNLLWASTVFFAPPAVGEFATAGKQSFATVAASLLGAAGGSNLFGVLRSLADSSDATYNFMRQLILRQVPVMLEGVSGVASEWLAKGVLVNELAKLAARGAKAPDQVTDDEFISYYNMISTKLQRYKIVWERLVFPSRLTPFSEGQVGLENFFSMELDYALQQYQDQFDKWRSEGPAGISDLVDYVRDHPFVPDIHYAGLPRSVSAGAYALRGGANPFGHKTPKKLPFAQPSAPLIIRLLRYLNHVERLPGLE